MEKGHLYFENGRDGIEILPGRVIRMEFDDLVAIDIFMDKLGKLRDKMEKLRDKMEPMIGVGTTRDNKVKGEICFRDGEGISVANGIDYGYTRLYFDSSFSLKWLISQLNILYEDMVAMEGRDEADNVEQES